MAIALTWKATIFADGTVERALAFDGATFKHFCVQEQVPERADLKARLSALKTCDEPSADDVAGLRPRQV